ncbi:MAG: nucleotidyltransferase domain-containing protein [Paraprevotella sp.]|nr:nucleotidyltransferase domain-containing protein [Paraprevotella sp.]
MISNSIKRVLPKIRKYLSGQPVSRAWLFGSCSRGEEGPESDVDILVCYDEQADVSLTTISRIMVALGKIVNRKVDLIEEDCLLPFAVESANRDKILIYEREDKG